MFQTSLMTEPFWILDFLKPVLVDNDNSHTELSKNEYFHLYDVCLTIAVPI